MAQEIRIASDSRFQQVIDELGAVEAELVSLGNRSGLTPGQEQHFSRLKAQRQRLVEERAGLAARKQRIEEIRSSTSRTLPGVPMANIDAGDDRTLDHDQAQALRSLEQVDDKLVGARSQDRMESLIRLDSPFAREFEIHSRPAYASAFMKLTTLGDPARASVVMSDEERQSLADSYSARLARAQSEGTSAAGGYAVPVFIDPTLLVQDQESPNAFMQIARTVDVTTNAWKGVSSPGMAWSFDPEGSAVSDDSLGSISQPTVSIFTARGFVPFTIEIEADWPGFQAEMARILAIGYDELLIDRFTNGSGTGEPKGLLTALEAASPTVIVTSMTDGAFGSEDIYATWAALPAKFRRRASWMMSVDVMNRIRQFGDYQHLHAVTVELPSGSIDRLFERPVYENPYMPGFTATTGAANRLVVGDFSEFVIARRAGMSVEIVPHLLDVTTGRPTGQRGFFAFARIGSNVVVNNGFRMQSNT